MSLAPLRRALRIALRDYLAAVLEREELAYGDEYAARESERPERCELLVFNLAQTPELEVHVRLLGDVCARLAERQRLLVVVEQTTEVLTAIYQRQPAVAELVGGVWVQLAALDPNIAQLFGTKRIDQPRRHLRDRRRLDFIDIVLLQDDRFGVRVCRVHKRLTCNLNNPSNQHSSIAG